MELKVAPAQDMPAPALSSTNIALSKLQETLGKSALKVLQGIVEDTQHRKDNYLTNHALLNSGIFYAEEYFQLLTTAQKDCETREKPSSSLKARIQMMIERGVFYHGMAPSSCFTQAPDRHSPTGRLRNTFKIKADCLPSTAIEKMVGTEKGLTLVGCTQVIQIVFAKVLLDHIGADKFNAIFSEKGVIPLSIGPDARDYALMSLFKIIFTPEQEHGDWVCFKGYEPYTLKHLFGTGDGENVLVNKTSPPTLYREFGLSKVGLTKEEIDQNFVTEYNKPQTVFEEILPPQFISNIFRGMASPIHYKRAEKSQITLAHFHSSNGGKIIFKGRLNAKRIEELISAPTTEAASECMARFVKKGPYE